jgi:hypothetical protein
LVSKNKNHKKKQKTKRTQKKLSRSFYFMLCYIDDDLSLNNSKFDDHVDRIYPTELEMILLGVIHTFTPRN